MDKDKLFKFLQRCNLRHGTPDMHSFKAKIKNGVVFVDCRGYEIYIESITYDSNGNEKRTRFAGTTIAATNRLEMLQIDFDSIEI